MPGVRQTLPAGAGKPWLSCATLVGMSGAPDTSRPEVQPVRRLIAMISTEGKTEEEMKAAARQAIQKFLAARSDGATAPESDSP